MNHIQTIILSACTSALMLAGRVSTRPWRRTQKAPNGGQLREARIYRFELVMAKDGNEARESPLVVYVTDRAGAKVSTAGASAAATILAGKTKVSATLVPDGDNRMKGTAKYASLPDLKVVLSITLSGKAAEQARFTPLAASKDAGTEHKH
ncbi:MAG: hypothetical protein IPP88_02410 [Betaproteobacteria bacterium]|nr:hypothetical protein [Betaproteobacteria bacterium]